MSDAVDSGGGARARLWRAGWAVVVSALTAAALVYAVGELPMSVGYYRRADWFVVALMGVATLAVWPGSLAATDGFGQAEDFEVTLRVLRDVAFVAVPAFGPALARLSLRSMRRAETTEGPTSAEPVSLPPPALRTRRRRVAVAALTVGAVLAFVVFADLNYIGHGTFLEPGDRVLATGVDEQVNSIAVGPDNTVFVVFGREPASGGLTYMSIRAYRADGSLAFDLPSPGGDIGGGRIESYVKLAPLADGGLAFGWIRDSQVHLRAVDAAGRTRWEQAFPSSTRGGYTAPSAGPIVLTDGAIAIAGFDKRVRSGPPTTIEGPGGSLHIYDPDGTERSTVGPDELTDDRILAMAPIGGGDLLAVASADIPDDLLVPGRHGPVFAEGPLKVGARRGILLRRLRGDGSEVWRQQLSDDPDDAVNGLLVRDESIVVAVTNPDPPRFDRGGPVRARLVEVAQDGSGRRDLERDALPDQVGEVWIGGSGAASYVVGCDYGLLFGILHDREEVGWLGRYESDGTITRTRRLVTDGTTCSIVAAVAPDGTLVLGGRIERAYRYEHSEPILVRLHA